MGGLETRNRDSGCPIRMMNVLPVDPLRVVWKHETVIGLSDANGVFASRWPPMGGLGARNRDRVV